MCVYFVRTLYVHVYMVCTLVHMHMYTHTCTHKLCTHACVHMHTHTRTHINVCTSVCVCVPVADLAMVPWVPWNLPSALTNPSRPIAALIHESQQRSSPPAELASRQGGAYQQPTRESSRALVRCTLSNFKFFSRI